MQSATNIVVTAIRNLLVRTNIDTTGDLALTAGKGTRMETDPVSGITAEVEVGAINFLTTREITLNGGSISLTADRAPTVSNQNLRINSATGDITINADINTGTRNLIIVAGVGNGAGTAQINLATTRAITLTGNYIRLESEADPDDAVANIIITAAANLDLYTDLNAVGFNLTLTSSRLIRVFGSRTLTGDVVSLMQAGAPFGAAKLFDVGAGTGSVVFNYAGDQAIYAWMAASNTNLTVNSGGNIQVNEGINAGTGDITLTASGALNFSTETAAITIAGAAITLTAAATAPTASNQDLTITASGALVIDARLNTGSGDLTLNAGTTLQFGSTGGSNIILTGRNITLTSDATAAPTGLRLLELRAADDITIAANINTGTRNLRLFAGRDGDGQLNFSGASVLSGQVIILSAPDAPTPSAYRSSR